VPLSELAGSDEIVVLRGSARRSACKSARHAPTTRGSATCTRERDDHRDETPVPAIVDGKQGSKPRNDGVGAHDVILVPTSGLEVFNDSVPESAADPAVADEVVDPVPIPDAPID
jgi:hypothetical protein